MTCDANYAAIVARGMVNCNPCNAGGKDTEGKRKQRLLSIFGDWTDMVTDLIRWVTHRQKQHIIWKRLDLVTHVQCQIYGV